jgi:PAS domain S-box-containing protein
MADDLTVAPPGVAGDHDLLAAALKAAQVMAAVVELSEDDFRYVAANEAAATFYGREEVVGRTGRELGLSEAQVRARLAQFEGCLAAERPEVHEIRFDGPAGRPGWYRITVSPLPRLEGGLPRASCLVMDITDRKRAEEDAERQRARLALALEAAGLGFWEYDLPADLVIWDARMRDLFGVGPEVTVDYATYASCIHPDDLPASRATYEAALAGENGGAYSLRHRTWTRDGSTRWVLGVGQVMFDEAGAPRRVIGTTRDVTAEVTAAERQALLLAELNHRVKNNLAAVQAIAGHTLRSSGEDPQAFRKAFEARLQSMARGHDLLTRNAWERAELNEVLEVALAPFANAAIRVVGGDRRVAVKPDLAVNLVLVLNELATNAAKYGALSVAGGEVALDWSVDASGVSLSWRERGGPQVEAPRQPGFGSRLTGSALKTFGGWSRLEFPPEGVTCAMWAPLSEDLTALS